jgi:hypothetical protein
MKPTPRHKELYQLVTGNLRDELKKVYARQIIEALTYEEASYWLSKARETRGKRAFRVLFGIGQY